MVQVSQSFCFDESLRNQEGIFCKGYSSWDHLKNNLWYILKGSKFCFKQALELLMEKWKMYALLNINNQFWWFCFHMAIVCILFFVCSNYLCFLLRWHVIIVVGCSFIKSWIHLFMKLVWYSYDQWDLTSLMCTPCTLKNHSNVHSFISYWTLMHGILCLALCIWILLYIFFFHTFYNN